MRRKGLAIAVTKENIFSSVYTFLNPLFNIRNAEIKVVGELLRYYTEANGAPEHVRWNYVFSKETKDKVRENLGITANNLRNSLSVLSKIKMPNGLTAIHKTNGYAEINNMLLLDVDPNDDMQLIIQFKLKAEPKEKNEELGIGDEV